MSRQHLRRPPFGRYLQFKLGRGWTAWVNFFIKPLGASSFAEFWRLWNPVYGYFLYHWSYRPLSPYLPRPMAAVATFVLCEFFLHDLPAWAVTRRVLPPGATLAFILFGAGAVLSEWLKLDISRWPFLLRAAVNLAYLGGCVGAMLLIVRLM